MNENRIRPGKNWREMVEKRVREMHELAKKRMEELAAQKKEAGQDEREDRN